MRADADTTAEQLEPTPTNPAAQNMMYVIIQSHIVMTVTNIDSVPQLSTERIRVSMHNFRKS